MKKSTFTLIAFMTAPVVPTLVGAFLTPNTTDYDTLTILTFALIFYCYSVGVTALFGAPMFFLLLRHHLVRWWSALLVGLALGVIVALIVRLPNLAHLDEVSILGSEGAISALVFWLIWKLGQKLGTGPTDARRESDI